MPRNKSAVRRRPVRRVTRRDRVVIALMLGVPTLLLVGLVWGPAALSVILSFFRWDGIGGVAAMRPVGFRNYEQLFTVDPIFWPAIRHNAIWMAVLVVPSLFGLLLAYLVDKELRFTGLYQSALFLPMVLSMALIGFICQLLFSQDQGLVDNLFGINIDWLGDPRINLWAVLMVAGWRHAGYVMILYLAGLKSIDTSLRDAAATDGANEWQAFRHVILPSLRPINIIVLVVTIMSSLGAFDLVYIVNNGRNGLELLSVLVTENITGAASRIGYGSAMGTLLLLISIGPIVTMLWQSFRKDAR